VQRCGLGQVVRGHHQQPGIDRSDPGAPALVDRGLHVVVDATSGDGAWKASPCWNFIANHLVQGRNRQYRVQP